MYVIKNEDGRIILLSIVKAIQDNKEYLGDIDGIIGDGDHGMNMNKGFTIFAKQLGDKQINFSDGLFDLGRVLLNRIGGSMGPIYGTVFMEMADTANNVDEIEVSLFCKMIENGLNALYEIVDARVGDKTLVDTLYSANESLKDSINDNIDFAKALNNMKKEAEKGMESTRDLVAKYGRAARLGERSRGSLDPGAVSCFIILSAMAEGMKEILKLEGVLNA